MLTRLSETRRKPHVSPFSFRLPEESIRHVNETFEPRSHRFRYPSAPCVFRVGVPRHFYAVFVREAHQTFSDDSDVPYSGRLFSELLLFAGLLTRLLDIPRQESATQI